jgi:hypothetical protein
VATDGAGLVRGDEVVDRRHPAPTIDSMMDRSFA